MQQLSSGLTVFNKRIFPAAVAGAVVLFVFAGIVAGRARTPGFFIAPLGVLAAVYAFWFFLLSELADEVADCGAYLLVRVGKVKERIALANIKDVKASRNSRTPVMTLYLVQPCGFGDSISFIPYDAVPFAGWGKGKLKDTLLQRADAARREAPPLEASPVENNSRHAP
jgi:hypothetical protein